MRDDAGSQPWHPGCGRLPEDDPDTDSPTVTVQVTRHGPLTRIAFSRPTPFGVAQLSVARLGSLLIDAGGTRVTRALLRVLRDDPPRRVLLTHQHEDHVGNLGALRRAFGDLPVLAPRDVLGIVAGTDRVPEYRAAYWGHPEPTSEASLTPYDPGDVIEEGPHRLEAIDTPGHTPPHVAFLLREARTPFALSGDLYTSRPLEAWLESAADDAIRSYRALARHAGLVLVPTHGRVRPDGERVLGEGADRLERESERVLRESERLGTRDPTTVADSLYGPDPKQRFTDGEICAAVFVRSVLDPVRELPAAPVRLPVA